MRLRLPVATAAASAAALSVCLLGVAPASAAPGLLETIPLPNDAVAGDVGFQPEGVVVRGSTAYVGSLVDGTVVTADLRTGETDVLVPADGDPAVGLELSGDLLLVAGGPSGEARAYDVDNGRLARAVQLAPEGEAFINDIAVLGTTAYATDSQDARLFAVPLRGPDAGTVREVPLSGDFALAQGFNANGIVAYRGQLVVAQTADPVDGEGSALYVVDPTTGAADRIEIRGGDVENADGLVVRGNLLAVVQNQSDSIAVLRLVRRRHERAAADRADRRRPGRPDDGGPRARRRPVRGQRALRHPALRRRRLRGRARRDPVTGRP